MLKKNQTTIPSVNFHLWQPCNMRCKFCFATFQDVRKSILPKGHLSREEAVAVTRALCEAGFSKITFVGGEPTLCPWITELIATAKSYGLTTMMVTNGSHLKAHCMIKLKPMLDWLCLSIDSLNPETNRQAGRMTTNGQVFGEAEYRVLVDAVRDAGFRLKINTVVHALNWQQQMSDFIDWAHPLRWKVFQVLPVGGQNNGSVEPLLITPEQYETFLQSHNSCRHKPVIESNHHMKGSYLMVDPSGRFFDNTEGKHRYSQPILKVGVETAQQEVICDYKKFLSRGGFFNWD